MRRDQQLVELFIRGYNKANGTGYMIVSWTDQVEREKQAVEAVARDDELGTLAIEHTLLQPFEGQKEDDQPFLSVFIRLESDPSLALPDWMIEIHVPVGVVPTGTRWNDAGTIVYEWFKAARHCFPEGDSEHEVPGLPFRLILGVSKTSLLNSPGKVFVDRILPTDKPFVEVLRRALRQKLPKLLRVEADKRMLLLEKGTTALGYAEIGRRIDSLQQEFPGLPEIDQIWVVNTVGWESGKIVYFYHVWPGGVCTKFNISC